MCPETVTRCVRGASAAVQWTSSTNSPQTKRSGMTFQPAARPTKVVPSRSSTRHDLGQQHAGVLGEELARLRADDDAERPQMPRQDRGPGVEVERPIALLQLRAQAAAGVDLLDRTAGVLQAAHHHGRLGDGVVERRQVLVEELVAEVEVDGVDGEVVAPRDRERLVELLGVDAELRRLLAAVDAEALLVGGRGADRHVGVGGAGPGVHADADATPGPAPPEALELRDQVDVHVHARGQDGVEVGVAQVRPRVADLGGQPAVGEAVLHLARRADVESDAARGAAAAAAARLIAAPTALTAARISGSRCALSASLTR